MLLALLWCLPAASCYRTHRSYSQQTVMPGASMGAVSTLAAQLVPVRITLAVPLPTVKGPLHRTARRRTQTNQKRQLNSRLLITAPPPTASVRAPHNLLFHGDETPVTILSCSFSDD